MTNNKIKKIAEESVRRGKFSPWEDRWVGDFDDCILSGGCVPQPECLGNLQNTIEIIGNITDNPELLEG